MDDMNKRHAFTLIEMLVVIAIIGIVAGMVLNMSGHAKAKQRQVQVEGDKQKLTLLIDNYQSKLNFYPPDNGNLISNNLTPANYDLWTAMNPLVYELTGATNTNSAILVFDTNVPVPVQTYQYAYARSGVNNANQDGPPRVFFQPQLTEYTTYSNSPLKGLLVPVPLPYPNNTNANFWHYDASSTNRHNLNSYDLWAEYAGPNGTLISNGNWQQ
jgi:prepilin-type N-terminal cleavage/methylation domain-containing protein